ncbi:putative fimbrial associated sortase-like protein [Corynebacterium diphtheriae BH8]|uniref:class C sortase n=1 Tax=Corynebacterium diphtheriae TaxID=1717 RepID=UPI000245BAB7|nr:class C sortase [Corynebacterium diphtheriae]AEX47711.1 putative fimbrial associated sortase-like protein [Corynebacterium diphtheriae BH8]
MARKNAKNDTSTPTNPSTQATSSSHKKKKKKGNPLIAVLIILVGVGVLLYPVVATQWNNFGQQRAADEYAKLEKSAPPEVLDTAWEDAHRYNESRPVSAQVMDAWNDHANESSPEYQQYLQYLSQLAETDAMGQIMIPSIKSKLPIYHGTGPSALDRGVGHLYGTDLPVGGENRHAVLSAHTGIQTATLWDNLVKVKEGDAFYVAVSGHKLKYEVDQIKVVTPDHTDDLGREPGKDYITLITCTPYGINTHRLLVRGHQVPMDPSEEKVFEESTVVWQWWMWAIVAAAALVLALLAWWLRKNSRKAQRSNLTQRSN